jgi:hypothetical protein
MQQKLTVQFQELPMNEANKYANSLTDLIVDCDASAEVKRSKLNPDTQDAGTVLQIVLAAASVKLVAAGIKAWLERNSGCQISITTDSIQINNINSTNAAKVLEAIMK